jgi:hypothetical protein
VTKPQRYLTWAILLALAAAQAWAGRFDMSPDGVAYLDLSDAIVAHWWGDIINPYWSPLYPAVIGVLRVLVRPSLYWEFAIPHLANLIFFAACLPAFEYFLGGLARSAATWGRPELGSARVRAAAYVFFGAFTLVMTPLTLTTPDMAVSAAVYVVFGALLRLRVGGGDAPRRAALMLGGALALGSLTKTFIILWSIVVLLSAGWMLHRAGKWKVLGWSVLCWGVVVGAWCAALSAHTGRLTYGDTGKLTFAWYVNMKGSPSSVEMPPRTRDAAMDAILPGTGAMPKGIGTLPLWYDPSRWYAGIEPEVDLPQQGRVFAFLGQALITALAPLVFLLALLIAASDTTRRLESAKRAWIVVLPSIAAIAGYTMILVATRYVVAFVIALAITLWAAFDWRGPLRPGALVLGLALPALVLWRFADASTAFATQAAVLSTVPLAWIARTQRRGYQMALALGGAVAVRILLPVRIPNLPQWGMVAAAVAVILVALWAARTGDRDRFGVIARQWLLASTALMLAFASAKKYVETLRQPGASRGGAHQSWEVAQRLRAQGLTPGRPVAIVGSPFEAYWARVLQTQIVAVVPPAQSLAFWMLPDDQRERLIAEFVRAGAQVLVVTNVPTGLAKQPAWRARYPSGVRVLAGPGVIAR